MIENKPINSNPNVSVDCVVFGYHDGELRVLLIERGAEPFEGFWALPGDLVGLDVNLFDSAYKVLFDLTSLDNVFLEQFQTFGCVDRHPVGRVVTVGYYALVETYRHNPVASAWAMRRDRVTLRVGRSDEETYAWDISPVSR